MAVIIPFPKPKSPPQSDSKNEFNCPNCHYVALLQCDLIAHVGQEHSPRPNLSK